MRPVACPPFPHHVRKQDGGHGASAPLPTLRNGAAGWAKTADANASGGVPTIPSPRPEARWWARRKCAFAHPTKRRRRVGKDSGRECVRWCAHHSLTTSGSKMVGTAQVRLCPPYESREDRLVAV